jgi:hypothetical protein
MEEGWGLCCTALSKSHTFLEHSLSDVLTFDGRSGSSRNKTRISYAKQVWFERGRPIIFFVTGQARFNGRFGTGKTVLENFDRYQTAESVLDSGRMRNDVHGG